MKALDTGCNKHVPLNTIHFSTSLVPRLLPVFLPLHAELKNWEEPGDEATLVLQYSLRISLPSVSGASVCWTRRWVTGSLGSHRSCLQRERQVETSPYSWRSFSHIWWGRAWWRLRQVHPLTFCDPWIWRSAALGPHRQSRAPLLIARYRCRHHVGREGLNENSQMRCEL